MFHNVRRFLMVALLALVSLVWVGVSHADYLVSASESARGPVRLGQDVTWASGQVRIVSDEVIGYYQAHPTVFTVVKGPSIGYIPSSTAALTTAELDILDGATVTTAELNILDGVTSTFTELNVLDGATTTFTELNYLDGTTPGTAVASKALAVDATLDISGLRDVGLTGDLTVTADSTGGNAGARSQIIGLPAIKLVALGTMTNGTTETTAYIDASPTGEWTEVDAGTNVAITADTTYYRDVTNSVKIAFGATAVENDGVSGAVPVQDDLTADASIGFWIYSDQALTSGDLDLTIDDSDGTDQAYTIGAVAADTWTWIELDISGCDANCDTTDNIVVALTAQGAAAFGVATGQAVNVYLDAMYKWAAADEEALGNAIIQDGVMSVATIATAAGTANTPAAPVEYTDYFIHYESGNDFLVTITDQSANSGIALIATE